MQPLNQLLGLFQSIVVHVNHEGYCKRWLWPELNGAWSVVATLRSVPSLAENLVCALFILSFHMYATGLGLSMMQQTKGLLDLAK